MESPRKSLSPMSRLSKFKRIKKLLNLQHMKYHLQHSFFFLVLGRAGWAAAACSLLPRARVERGACWLRRAAQGRTSEWTLRPPFAPPTVAREKVCEQVCERVRSPARRRW